MRLNFENVYPLWLILPMMALVGLTFYRYAKKNTRQKLFLILRTLAVLLIILSMTSLSIVRTAEDTATIFVCDLSDSTMDRQKNIEAFVADALGSKGNHDITGIIGFGENSSTENEPSKTTVFNGFQTYVNGDFTDIQSALIHGTALLPPNAKKRIVLITDGLENSGDSERQLRSLLQNDTVVDVYPVIRGDFEEVQLSKVMVPEKAGKNQIIDITAQIDSNVETEATILLYTGNAIKYEQRVTLDVGTNKFIFTDTVTEGGVITYRVEIIPEKDTYMENNYLSSFCTVKDQPVILLVQEEDGQGEQLIKMLESSMTIDVMLPEEAPQTFESLIKYDAFILADVSIERFDEAFLTNLEAVIKNQGKGLLVTGGDSSYGPGGYYQTILEDILPVNIDVKPKQEKPNLGLVLVIDKSGSMTEGQYGISKLELAKEAAIRATEVLEPKDFLGVIAFDDTIKWPVELQLAEDPEALRDMIATIVPGGGTSIRPALEEAVNTLMDSEVKLKHIILLTDGQAETTGYETALKNMKDNGITLSTVAVGRGSDQALLQFLATAGNGRFYSTDEFSDIPSIFTKEAFMAGKKYLNNITFSPTLINWSQIMKGIDSVPELDGYVATRIKDTSKLLLAGPEDDPILATWQYGLGRTAAWTSDANGLWTAKWLAWEQSQGFWTNLVAWLVQQDLDKKYAAETAYFSGQGLITVTSLDKEEAQATTITGLLMTPSGQEEEITLEATAPGTYTGTFEAEGEGVYMANLMLQSDTQTEKIVTGLNVGYSPEYNFYGGGGITPERIVELSGGRILTDPSQVFEGLVPPVEGSNNISNILLLVGLILFVLEIIVRKTYLNLSFIDKIVDRGRRFVALGVGKVREMRGVRAARVVDGARGGAVQNLKGLKDNDKISSDLNITTTSRTVKKGEVKKVPASEDHLDTLLSKKRKRDGN